MTNTHKQLLILIINKISTNQMHITRIYITIKIKYNHTMLLKVFLNLIKHMIKKLQFRNNINYKKININGVNQAVAVVSDMNKSNNIEKRLIN